MAMRDLVTGGAACAVPGSPSSSNPLGVLASKLVGSSSKQQERLKEIPTSATTIPENRLYPDTNERLTELPGSEFDNQLLPSVQNSRFLESFQSSDQSAFTNVWDEIQHPQAFLSQDRGHFQGHEYDGGVSSQPQSLFDGPPQRVLSTFLRSFIDSSRGAIPFQPSPVPVLGLSEGDKQCIRDRSSIMARHFFADRSEDFINAQVNALLCSLDIDNDMRAKQPIPGRFRELEEYWNESQGPLNTVPHSEDRWVAEYRQQNAERADPSAWVHSFEQQHGANGWASEFDQEQSQMASLKQVNTPGLAALEQTRMLADTLAQNDDPRFQNSKFLQFVSKMSRGELIIDDNQVKPREIPAKTDWVAEYEQGGRGVDWANQFAENNAVNMSERWVDEFGTEYGQHAKADDPWVDEFSKLHIQDWAKEYEQQLDNNTADTWAGAYDEFLDEQTAAKNSSKGVYVFSDMNPYVGHPAPLKQGQELFQNGLLSEAVLALEAEVLKNPNNAEGWRLLGITHAENDDDQQAIAAMICAQEAVPTHLEVLLALGVSHTNELEQTAALKYLYSWLHHHPKYRALATTPPSDSLYYADVARLFSEAAETSPEDADVHIVLGVLYNLSRKYDKAVASFQKALQLRPHDYSLWNKLGATQANSVQCASAIEAYQQALDLKPNYVRAWANMGISYANQSLYEDSIRYYVRAVTMNPKADNVWRYLRISLSHASRTDMVEACDSRNIDVLQKEFPLY